MSTQKLQLTWIGKDRRIKLEPRILIEDKDKSYGDPDSGNMLIHGDNLLALKALEQDYTGKIKCIYIDPPYNTGNAFEHYDDGLEHSEWLNLIRPRLEILKKLLCDNGIIFVQIGDDEMAYLKVIMDEVFGRSNFINQVSVKMKQTSGASGGGEDKRLKKNIEYILIYTKNYSTFVKFNEVLEEENLFDLIQEMKDEGKSWKYTRVLKSLGVRTFLTETVDGSGMPIKIYSHEGVEIKTISELAQQEGMTEEQIYIKYFDLIFRDTNAQSSIRTRVMEATQGSGDFFSIDYVPRSGKSKGRYTTLYYKGNNRDLIAWLKDVAVKKGNTLVKLEKLGTYWEGFPLNNLTKEGGVQFPNGKKPEALIQRIIELASTEGDLILDSFLGSGTTASVAHKMGRRWIGIEMGDHIYSHCKIRLDKIIDGEDGGGITESVSWEGGCGYKFYELGPSLLARDEHGKYIINPNMNGEMLTRALCKIENFKYMPKDGDLIKHGFSTEKDFIHITTRMIDQETIERIASKNLLEDESLLIMSKTVEKGLRLPPNIQVKKIPNEIYRKYEYAKDDYSLPILSETKEKLIDLKSELNILSNNQAKLGD